MPTNPSTGDYNYTLIGAVPGWATIVTNPNFNSMVGAFVNYLDLLILDTFAFAAQGGANPLLNINSNDNWVTLDITFTSNLSDADITTLNGLVNRMADYFIITTDGSTSLGNPANVSAGAGSGLTTSVTLVYKQGDGTTRTGFADPIAVVAIPTSIDKTTGYMDATSGTFTFTFGTQTMKGTISANLTVGQLQPMTLNVTWS